jgi:hypothetical protein
MAAIKKSEVDAYNNHIYKRCEERINKLLLEEYEGKEISARLGYEESTRPIKNRLEKEYTEAGWIVKIDTGKIPGTEKPTFIIIT